MEVELRIGKKCESVSDVEFVARKESAFCTVLVK
jgi:hypothetical protein